MDKEQFKQQYMNYRRQNQYQEAVELCDQYIEENPADSLAYLYRGTAKNDLKLYEEAIKDYDESIRLDSNDAIAYNNRGLAKNNLKRYEEAIKDYDEAIRLDPNNAIAYNNRGLAKNELKLHEEALKDFDEAIRLNPEYATTYYNRGATKYDLKRYVEAMKDLDEAIRLEPNNALYLQNKFITEQQIRDIARDEENKEFRNGLEEQYKKRKQELEEQYKTKDRLKITDGFLNNVNEFKAAKNIFFWCTILIAIIIFALIIIVVFVDISSVKNLKLYERYLLLSPILFVEFILYSGYIRNRNLETFYKHNLTVGNSLFEIRSEFFKGSDGNISNDELGEYRKFGLIQYEKLYEQPRLLSKHSLFAKNGKKEFSYANSSGNDSSRPK